MIKKIGGWAFLIGVLIAIIAGIIGPIDKTVTIVLVVLGLIVGLLNITEKEVTPFLLAAVALVIVANFGGSVLGVIDILKQILTAIMALIVPATIVVAIKEVFTVAKR